ncbi:MAG TPA: YdiU family protein, partial [Nevskiaceae bacterium]|nr:YdiU family protein [Nevskiaceae bacterium]
MPTHALDSLPLDNRYARLPVDYHSHVAPTPLPAPRLLHFNEEAARLIDLDPREAQRPEFAEIFGGNRPLPGGDPVSMLYAGHQFGVWVPQLGDGRAILLGQVRNSRGDSWDLQLKGAGPTPYSRHADGRAVLRSSVREYLCGEAMHHLGIPTTRALCVVTSPAPVRRETIETAAVICRMAPSHVRFGNFEVFYYRNQHALLKPLADHVIAEHYPQHAGDYAAWLGEVVERTARLMAMWQAVGFCHGVMNTDNMSVLGITLDYGPYGFMDGFEAGHICNHSDDGGRYAYDQQPMIGHWNCSRLVQACLPLLHETPERAVEIGSAILDRYPPAYAKEMMARWLSKLGLREERDGDVPLVNRWLHLLDSGRSDFTRSFRALAQVGTRADAPAPALRDEMVNLAAFDAWLAQYRERLRAEHSDDADRAARMNQVNPKYVLRNHLAQAAIDAAQQGSAAEIDRLMQLLRRPYD